MDQSLASVMRNINDALRLDDDSHDKEAYMKYLDCVLCITCNLQQSVRDNGGDVVISRSTTKQVKLAQQCIDRVSVLVEKLGSRQRPMVLKSPADDSLRPKPFAVVPPLPMDPEVHTYARKRGRTPMEVAYEQNQLIMAAYRARMGRMNRGDPGAFNLSLTIQRKMAENLAIARKTEMALAKKMQERQERLEVQAAKRFVTPTGMSAEEKEQRQIYKRILDYEQDSKRLQAWRSKLETSPEEPELICKLIQEILRCRDHPLTLLLKQYQNKIYQKIYPLVYSKRQRLAAVVVPLPGSMWPCEEQVPDTCRLTIGKKDGESRGGEDSDISFPRPVNDSNSPSPDESTAEHDQARDNLAKSPKMNNDAASDNHANSPKMNNDTASDNLVNTSKTDSDKASDNLVDTPKVDNDKASDNLVDASKTESDKASDNLADTSKIDNDKGSDKRETAPNQLTDNTEDGLHIEPHNANDYNQSETLSVNHEEERDERMCNEKDSEKYSSHMLDTSEHNNAENVSTLSAEKPGKNDSESESNEDDAQSDASSTSERNLGPVSGFADSTVHAESNGVSRDKELTQSENKDEIEKNEDVSQNNSSLTETDGANAAAEWTADTKENVARAITKGDALQSRLKEEQARAVRILRQVSQEYEKYNAENMDDLFEDEAATQQTTPETQHSPAEWDLPESDQSASLSNSSVSGGDSLVSGSGSDCSGRMGTEGEVERLSKEAYSRHVKGVSADVHRYMERLLVLFTIAYEQLNCPLGRDQCYASLEETFFKPIWKYLLMLFRLSHYKEEVSVAYKMTQKAEATPKEMGVRSKLCLTPEGGRSPGQAEHRPYQRAISQLSCVKDHYTMLSKLECVVKMVHQVCDSVKDYYIERGCQPADVPSIGADDLVPIISYVVLQSGLPQLVSECHAMSEFIHEGYIMGQEGYCLTTLETAVSYIVSSDLKDPCPASPS